ncbi:hypothetical protein MRX96_049269 [Rhipicephalus microplus]
MALLASDIDCTGCSKRCSDCAWDPEGRARLVTELSAMEHVGLVHNDPATCAIYINRIFDVIINVLHGRRHSPLRPYTVVDSFKQVEFQLRESARIHTTHCIDNAPNVGSRRAASHLKTGSEGAPTHADRSISGPTYPSLGARIL